MLGLNILCWLSSLSPLMCDGDLSSTFLSHLLCIPLIAHLDNCSTVLFGCPSQKLRSHPSLFSLSPLPAVRKRSSFDWPLWCLCSLSTSAPRLSARASFGGFSSSSLLTRLPDSRLVCPIHSSFCLPEWALINANLFRSYFYLKFFSRPIFSLE